MGRGGRDGTNQKLEVQGSSSLSCNRRMADKCSTLGWEGNRDPKAKGKTGRMKTGRKDV